MPLRNKEYPRLASSIPFPDFRSLSVTWRIRLILMGSLIWCGKAANGTLQVFGTVVLSLRDTP